MEIRTLPISQGLTWFKQAIDLGGHNPKGVFGAAALMIVVFYAIMLAAIAPMVAALPETSGGDADMAAMMGRLWPFMAVLVLAVSVLMPFFIGGLMHVIRETEAGRRPGALALFQPFRSGHGGRLIAVGLIVLAIQIVGGVLVMLSGGREYVDAYTEMMRSLMAGADPRTLAAPDSNALMFLLQVAVNYVAYAVFLFSVPSILFLGRGLGESLAGSLKASVRNIGANLLAGVLLVAGLIVAALLFGLLMMLVALIASAIHGLFATIVMLVLGLLFASAVMVVMIGAAWLAWRDTFGEGPVPTTPAAGIEA